MRDLPLKRVRDLIAAIQKIRILVQLHDDLRSEQSVVPDGRGDVVRVLDLARLRETRQNVILHDMTFCWSYRQRLGMRHP